MTSSLESRSDWLNGVPDGVQSYPFRKVIHSVNQQQYVKKYSSYRNKMDLFRILKGLSHLKTYINVKAL